MHQTFNLETAQASARSSLFAYDNGPVGTSMLISHRGTECRIWIGDRHSPTTVAFRGTEINSLRDIRFDLNLAHADCAIGACHRGFARAWNMVAPQVLDIIKNECGDSPIILTGHSLGGAIATRAALDMPKERLEAIYTFGQPRVYLNGAAAKYPYNKIHWRVVNDADLFVRLVPALMGYRHVGQIAFIDGKQKLHINPSWWFMAREFWNDRLGNRTRDHKMADYLKILEGMDG